MGQKGWGNSSRTKWETTVDGLYANDPALWPIWETTIELDIPVLCHFGASHRHPITGEPNPRENPEYYAEVLDRFPKLKMIMLHMGVTAAYEWPELYQSSREAGLAFAKSHPNIICDISGNLAYGMPIKDLVESIREVGAERVIWGSDFMWVNPLKELELLLESDLTEKEKRLVLGENAIRFFNLKI